MNTFPRNSAGAAGVAGAGASAGALGARATGALDAALDARATGAALGASSEALDAALDANVGAVDSHAADKISAAGHCASGDCASEAADTAAPLLEVRHVSKAFGHKPVLQDLCLELYPGEIVSILGISGSGKSTLFNIIAGLIAPDEGQILLRGHDVTGKRGHVAYMLQKDLLLPHLTILDNVALPLLIRGSSKAEARAKALPLIPQFGLSGYEKLYPAQLSGGMAQRAAFLRTYLFSSEVALLDEPFSALDAMTKEQIQNWYLEMMQQLQLSTLFITHDIDEAIRLSDRIAILHPAELRIVEIITIDPALRRSKDLYLRPEFLVYKKAILGVLGAEA